MAQRTYQKNREAILARAATKNKRDRETLIAEHGGECIDCHTTEQCVLEFHHREGVEVVRGVITGTRSLDRKRKEAAKCDLLCANCHLRRHRDE